VLKGDETMSILEGGTNKRPTPAFTTGTISASTAQKKKAKNEDTAAAPAWLNGGAVYGSEDTRDTKIYNPTQYPAINQGINFASRMIPAWQRNFATLGNTPHQGRFGTGGTVPVNVDGNGGYSPIASAIGSWWGSLNTPNARSGYVPPASPFQAPAGPYNLIDKGERDNPISGIPTGTFLAANGQAARYGESNTYNPLGNNDNPWLMIKKKATSSGGGSSGGGSSGGWGRGGGGWSPRTYSDWGNNGYTPTTYTQKEYDPNMGLYSWNFKG
jgi:hypothetical protein